MADRVGFEHIGRSSGLALGYPISHFRCRELASVGRTVGKERVAVEVGRPTEWQLSQFRGAKADSQDKTLMPLPG